MLSDEVIRQRVIEIVNVVLGQAMPTEQARPEPQVEWDSLRHIEIILAVEEEFDITVPEADFASLRSIDSISAHLTRLRASH
jgi:acyl carrier protein